MPTGWEIFCWSAFTSYSSGESPSSDRGAYSACEPEKNEQLARAMM